ncbi:MAG: type I DNA topoisomerase, partial [bacterium]
MNKYIVVESAAKTKTIRRFLRGEYNVIACGGHIIDLTDEGLGVDVENNFELQTEPIYFRGNNKVKNVRKKLQDADEVYLATDPDREGEAIAADLKKHCVPGTANSKRIVFNAIVYHEIKEAMESPRAIDYQLVESQRARRALDRLIGFIISSTTQFDPGGPGLPAAGRVMSPAVSLVVDREREIEKFEPRHYWTLQTELDTSGETLEAQFEGEFDDFDNVKDIVTKLQERGELEVSNYDENPEDKLNPPPPYTTDSLQNDADRLLGFTPERTMKLAQQLYQGVEIDGKPQALITYMRTDSTRVSPHALNLAKETFKSRSDTVPELYKGRPWQPRGNEQDAHEAIRPTMPEEEEFFPSSLSDEIDEDLLDLYRLIYFRFLSSQSQPAVYHTTNIKLRGGKHRAEAEGHQLKSNGFLKLYRKIHPEYGWNEVKLPELKKGQKVTMKRIWPEPEQTHPPARYREGMLVSELKNRGIGRPSTYGAILQKIKQGRGGFGYLRKVRGKLHPTERGEQICDYLRDKFEQVISYSYTAKMEEELAKIEQGENTYEEFLQDEFQWLEKPYRVAREKGWLSGDKPTPAQVKFAKKLAEETQTRLPDSAFESKDEISEWIDKLQDKVTPRIKLSSIHPAEVGGVKCYRIRLYFNRPLPDEEKEFLKEQKMKYKRGKEDRWPSYQYQRQDKKAVQKLRNKLKERYSEPGSPVEHWS